MSATELLEVGTIFGSIIAVWFALVGWKLVRSTRAHRFARPACAHPDT
jgi:hypothetical protein